MYSLSSKCIFVDVPKSCQFFRGNLCAAPPSHTLECATNHRRLMLKPGAKRRLVKLFTEVVIESPNRIKSLSGQKGRDLLDQEKAH